MQYTYQKPTKEYLKQKKTTTKDKCTKVRKILKKKSKEEKKIYQRNTNRRKIYK